MSFANEGISFAIQYSPAHTAFDQFLTSYMKDNDCPEYIAKIQRLVRVSQPDIQITSDGFPLQNNNIDSRVLSWLRGFSEQWKLLLAQVR